MNAPKQFGFKERKDGSMIHHGSDYAVVVYPSKDNRWGIGIHQDRWAATYWVPLTANCKKSAALYALDWLADPLHHV